MEEYKRLVLIEEETKKIVIDKERLIDLSSEDIHSFIELREDGDFEDQGFFLDDNYEWVIGRDSTNALVLIPLEI